VITAGEVKVCLLSPEGDEVILAMLGAGESFGEMALLDDQPRSATVETTTTTEVLVIHRTDFYRYLRQEPDVAIALLRLLAARLRDTNQMVSDSAFLDIPQRVAKKLLTLAATHGRRDAAGTAIELHITQQDLAAMVGATRESVNRALASLRDRGVLTLSRQHIIIHRAEELLA